MARARVTSPRWVEDADTRLAHHAFSALSPSVVELLTDIAWNSRHFASGREDLIAAALNADITGDALADADLKRERAQLVALRRVIEHIPEETAQGRPLQGARGRAVRLGWIDARIARLDLRIGEQIRQRKQAPPTARRESGAVAQPTRSAGGNPDADKSQTSNAGVNSTTPNAERAILGLGPGHPLPAAERAFFEPRFGRDLSAVRIHTDDSANKASRAINARAFALGRDIAFASGEYAPGTAKGRRLIAHELAHVGAGSRDPRPTIRRQQLEYKPAANPEPCACLVFVHNNERNARETIESLYRTCRYNLAIIENTGRSRPITVRSGGSTVRLDPNELFPQSIRTECERDLAACRAYSTGHSDLRAAQMQFYLAIRDCSNNFGLPTVALHNNTVGETSSFRSGSLGPTALNFLRGEYARGGGQGIETLETLRARLAAASSRHRRNFVRVVTLPGTTNIFRWCNLPEIGRCAVGDPSHPDDVIWTVNESDYASFARQGLNVVLQTGVSEGGESDTDLSTLFMQMHGPRYSNVETPHRRPGESAQASSRNNLAFVVSALQALGLHCCDVPGEPETAGHQDQSE
ncbi:MAG: DUF4157 domain-containing protein [bacterium]|nr:DUF4157 domain-containing protein [bacterium]